VFSYVDQSIRRRLVQSGQLVSLDREGRPVSPDDSGTPFISMLGPIPLYREHRGQERSLHWYPFVHRVELDRVLDAASGVGQGGEDRFRELLQTNMSVSSVLASPDFLQHPEPLVRIHSCCMTGDVFGSLRCECGPQLEEAVTRILDDGGGAVVYMSGHEGRGIGLWAKAVTYILQDAGQDTYQANVTLGLPEDSRDFTDAAVALRYLVGGKPIRLLSNNPMKREQLERAGQPVSEMVPVLAGVSPRNLRYMRSKRSKGHTLPHDL
jgi:GTP cyclohydrolase II